MSWEQKEMDRILRKRYQDVPMNLTELREHVSVSDTTFSILKRWSEQNGRHVVFDYDSKNKEDWLLFFLTSRGDVFFIFDLFRKAPQSVEDAILRIIRCEMSDEKECENPLISKTDFYFWNPKPSIEKMNILSSPEWDYFSSESREEKQSNSLPLRLRLEENKMNSKSKSKSPSTESKSKSKSLNSKSSKSKSKSKSKSPKSKSKSESKSKSKSPKSKSKSESKSKSKSPKSKSKSKSPKSKSKSKSPKSKSKSKSPKSKSPKSKSKSKSPKSPESKSKSPKSLKSKSQSPEAKSHSVDSQQTIPIGFDEKVSVCSPIPSIQKSKPTLDYFERGSISAHVFFQPKSNVIAEWDAFTFLIQDKDGKKFQIQFYQRIEATKEQTLINRYLANHDFYPNFNAFGFDELRWVATKVQLVGVPLLDWLQTNKWSSGIALLLERLLLKLTKANIYATHLDFRSIQITSDHKLYLLHSICLHRKLTLEQQHAQFVKNIGKHKKIHSQALLLEWMESLSVDPNSVLETPNASDREQLMLETDVSAREFIHWHFGEEALDLIEGPILSIKKACQPNQPFVFKLGNNTILKVTKSKNKKYTDVAKYEILMHQALLDASRTKLKGDAFHTKMAPDLYKVKEWTNAEGETCIGSIQERLTTFMSLLYGPKKIDFIALFTSFFDYFVKLCALGFTFNDTHIGNFFAITNEAGETRMGVFDYEYASLGHSTTDCFWTQELITLAWSINQEKPRLPQKKVSALMLALRHLHQLMINKTKTQKTNRVIAMPDTYYNNYEKDIAFYLMEMHQNIIFKDRPDFAMRRKYVAEHIRDWHDLLLSKK